MAKFLSATTRQFVFTPLLAFGFILTGCQFKTPAKVTPPVNSGADMVQKAFFFPGLNFKPGQCSEQTFMATWAPVDERGIYGEWFVMRGVPEATHLNIYWCFTESALVGYQINPSFEDQRPHATSVFEIPIKKHYYFEAKKDGYQRDTNEMIKNDTRNPWMHSPYMDLDFAAIKVSSRAYGIFGSGGVMQAAMSPSKIAVSNIEWDYATQYFAFTVEVRDAIFSADAQTRFRFNFKAFNTKTDFERTPYAPELSRHINVLHVLGKTPDGERSTTYAGHWDVRKPVTFYTHGVPPGQMEIVQDVFNEWNEAFVRAGIVAPGKKALILNTTPLKNAVDLRYPVINWVTDRRESLGSPLGIGLASADVQTGEFLYGSVTVWTGLLEEIMNRFAASESGYAGKGSKLGRTHIDRNSLMDVNALKTSAGLFGDPSTGVLGALQSTESYERLKASLDILKENDSSMFRAAMVEKLTEDPELAKQINIADLNEAELGTARNSLLTKEKYLGYLKDDVEAEFQERQQLIDMVSVFHNHFSSELFNAPTLQPVAVNQSEMSEDQSTSLVQKLAQGEIQKSINLMVQDVDRSAEDVIPELIAGMQAAGLSEKEILRSAIKFLLIHELGHVLGLGHNFKGNVLPRKGEVADEHYNQIKQQLDDKGYVATSVMDYYNGRTEAIMKYEDIKVGPYDEMMLRYLYKAEYPAIADGGKTLKYLKVPKNGIVPGEPVLNETDGKEYSVAFLPYCNDIFASINVDPMCMRFDRGHNASTSMKYRFDDYNASLQAMLNAYTSAKGGGSYAKQAGVWYKTFREFTQIRSFYDYMRMKIDDTPKYNDAFANIRGSQEALLAFAEACIDPNKAPAKFKKGFCRSVFE